MKLASVKYCCDDDMQAYERYYRNQYGNGLPVFYGARMQKGHGLGSIFGGLFRSVFPFIKKFAPIVSRKALQIGVRITSDVADGQSLKDAAKTRIFGAIEEGINKIIPHTDGQSGSGSRRKRFRRHRPSHRGQSKKKRKLDIFS